MPKLPPDRMPKLRYHSGSGRWFVQFPGENPRYLGPDQAEARRRYEAECARWLARGRRPEVAPPPGAPTVADLAGRFRAAVESSPVSGSERAMVRCALEAVLRLHADTPADQFGPAAYKEVRADLVRRGLSRATVKGYLHRVKQMYRWAAEEEILPAEHWHALRAVRPSRAADAGRATPPVLPPGPGVVEATLPFLSHHWHDLVAVQRLTGMRPGEVCRMRVDEVDRSGPVWYYRPGRHKMTYAGHDRVVRIGPQAQAILGPRLDAAPRHGGWAFPAPRNRTRPVDPKSYGTAILTACRRAGLPPWHAHQLRHETATRLRAARGPEVAQAQLGHARINQTERYAQQHGEAADRAIAELG